MTKKSRVGLTRLFKFYRNLIFLISQLPESKEGCFGDVYHLRPVASFAMVARHVIIGVCVGMIPNDRNTELGKSTIIATTYRLIPRTIVRVKFQTISYDVILQPVTEHWISFCIEVYEMFWVGFVVVTTNHIVVQVTFHFTDFRINLCEILRAEQAFFFTIPESEDGSAFRLFTSGKECTGYLQYCLNT